MVHRQSHHLEHAPVSQMQRALWQPQRAEVGAERALRQPLAPLLEAHTHGEVNAHDAFAWDRDRWIDRYLALRLARHTIPRRWATPPKHKGTVYGDDEIARVDSWITYYALSTRLLTCLGQAAARADSRGTCRGQTA